MNEQVDIAEDLGVVQPALLELVLFPAVRGIATKCTAADHRRDLHQGCKMVLGGTSKSNKLWSPLDLALSVASGMIGNNFSNKAFDSNFLLL